MNIRLKVYMKRDSISPVYERIIDWIDSIRFPFEQTFDTMKALYGKDCVVSFDIL